LIDWHALAKKDLASFALFEYPTMIQINRVLSLAVSLSERAKRDPLYTGRVIEEPVAMVMRAAASWFRFGSLQIIAQRKQWELLKACH
jgi:uncharacterized protein YdiU (UPF0061 family)